MSLLSPSGLTEPVFSQHLSLKFIITEKKYGQILGLDQDPVPASG